MRTLQVASGDFFSTYGGGQVYVKNIVDEMIRRGDDVSVLSFVSKPNNGQNLTVEYENYNGSTLVEVGGEICGDDLSEIIRKIQPNVIHAHSHKAEICLIGKKLRVPVVVTAHHGGILCPAGTYMNYKDEICSCVVSHENCLRCCLQGIRSGRYWYPLMKHLPKSSYHKLGAFLKTKRFIPFITPIGQVAYNIECKQIEWNTISELSTRMIAPSEAIAEAMVRNGIDSSKVSVIPHGIPCPDITPSSSAKINDSIVRLFFVGRISRIKGVHILLEAFAAYEAVNIELHIIGGAGNKSEQRYMDSMQRKYRNDSRVVWHGKISPEMIFDAICGYDIMVHPTICLEVFGLNISEALAMGKPVLATRCGGAEMQIEDGVNGWLVEPNNVEVLLLAIKRAVKDYSTLSAVDSRVISISDHCGALNKLYLDEFKA